MLEWEARAEALPPAGVVAAGACARALLRALGQRDAAQHQGTSLVATRDMLVVLGDPATLPWADGVRYCAPAPHAPGLWLPTHLQPTLPVDLVHAALQRRASLVRMLLWPSPEQLIPLDDAIAVTPAALAWLEQELD